MSEKETMIRLEGIKKRFRTKAGELEVLHGVSADIKKGEVFGIIGLSGAGKSTLVRCINLLERPTAGKVWLDGVELTALGDKELREQRRHMGMIFQQFHLLMQRTALDNVCFPMEISGVPKAKAKERAKELLDLVGLADRMESYPAQLSGGQKQRVAIARALATEPKVLLCDEATSALDPNTTAGVLSLLKDINTRLGITIVVITHEMSVIQEICDRVAIIDGGLIAEEGGVEEIFRAPKTKIGQELVMHEGTNREAYTGKLPYSYRLVFKGGSENEPVLGQMMIELKNVVNILAANTRTIENQAFGQMVVQFPEEKEIRQKMIQYLTDRGVEVEEVDMFKEGMLALVGQGFIETIYMTVISTVLAYIIGLPLGLVLVVTDKDGIHPVPWPEQPFGNDYQLLPLHPLLDSPDCADALHKNGGRHHHRCEGGDCRSLDQQAAPFIARMVESSLKEVEIGVVEAAQSMGASPFQIMTKVLLPEAKPSLLVGAAISITTILGYSAMAGIVGAGGLGAIAINYGYYRKQSDIMYVMVILMAIIVLVFQELGMRISKHTDRRL